MNCPGKNCVDCTKDKGKKCSTCEPLYQLSNGLCKSTCAKGSYADIRKRVCTKCHNLCTTCNGPTKHNCLECKRKALTLLKDDKTISCVRECPHGFFKQENFCYSCESGCESCTSIDDCTKCNSPFVLFKKKCQSQCPTSFFRNTTTSICESCQIYGNCLECNETRCLQCNNNTHLRDSIKCVSDCGVGHFSSNNTCLPCQGTYTNCSVCNSSNCIECLSGYTIKDGDCVILSKTTESSSTELPTSTSTMTSTLPTSLPSKSTQSVTSVTSTVHLESKVKAEFIGEDTEETVIKDLHNMMKKRPGDFHVIENNDDIDQSVEDGSSSEEMIQSLSEKSSTPKSLYQLDDEQPEENYNLLDDTNTVKNKVITIKHDIDNHDNDTVSKSTIKRNNRTAKLVTNEDDNKKKFRARRSLEDSFDTSNDFTSSSKENQSSFMSAVVCIVIVVSICGVLFSIIQTRKKGDDDKIVS